MSAYEVKLSVAAIALSWLIVWLVVHFLPGTGYYAWRIYVGFWIIWAVSVFKTTRRETIEGESATIADHYRTSGGLLW
jgi:hypothetical protein